MSRVIITAKTLDLALIRAAGQLGTSSDRVEHQIKTETSGFLGLGKKITIEAWKNSGRSKSRSTKGAKSLSKRHPKRHRTSNNENTEKTVLSSDQVAKLKEELTDFLGNVAELTVGEKVSVESALENGRLTLDIKSEYLAEQFLKNSKIADSFEHLLKKKPRHIKQELPFRVFVDAQGVRVSREIELSEMARNLSEKVFSENKPVVLNYKSSYDRKIIHMTLDKDDRVYTKSIGKGPSRKLMILPSKEMEAADG